MRKVVLYIAMSLDGYIADSDGGIGWLDGNGSDTDSFGSFINTVDTVILGYKTYHQIVTELSPDDWVYHGKTSYVLTHKELTPTDEIVFVSKDVCELINELKSADGKDIWICGGAEIANELMKKNLIDRYQLSVFPLILGGGVRLFSKEMPKIPLELKSSVSSGGVTEMTYEVKR